tara:strand:+ start:2207 stop:2392 length:186 start_codon:yes stop_codon:yes gene_type:complete
MTLKEASNSIGRNVIYTPFKGCDNSLLEYGVITEVNDSYVFVRYGSNVNAQSTYPQDLELA